jgi:hypothetical protein
MASLTCNAERILCHTSKGHFLTIDFGALAILNFIEENSDQSIDVKVNCKRSHESTGKQ